MNKETFQKLQEEANQIQQLLAVNPDLSATLEPRLAEIKNLINVEHYPTFDGMTFYSESKARDITDAAIRQMRIDLMYDYIMGDNVVTENTEPIEQLPQPTKREPDAYWDKFADALKAEFAESHDTNDEDDVYGWWLQDVTVADIVDFVKNHKP
jgi:hypothetical protein